MRLHAETTTDAGGHTYSVAMKILDPPVPIGRRPNRATRRAMRDAESGHGLRRYPDADSMFRALGLNPE